MLLDKDNVAFKLLCSAFLGVSETKFKEDIFNIPQFEKMLRNEMSENSYSGIEKAAWN